MWRMGSIFCKRKKKDSAKSSNEVDELTGLTETDKNLIYQTWVLLGNKKDITSNGVALFLELFAEHPQLKEYFVVFRDMRTEELKYSNQLKTHATAVMFGVTSYVQTLDSPEVLVGLIQKMSKTHVKRGVSSFDLDRFAIVFAKFLKEALGQDFQPEIEAAWVKFLRFHNSIFAEVERDIVGNISDPNERDQLQQKIEEVLQQIGQEDNDSLSTAVDENGVRNGGNVRFGEEVITIQ